MIPKTDSDTNRRLDGLTSSVDSNRLYSILLDARAASVSENMYDIAEKILANEKENAKAALEKLWSLKKNMQTNGETQTVDLLISHYQNKIDVLRDREEHIKKVSKESRSLLEEKRQKDSSLAAVKLEIEECTGQLEKLTETLRQARVREQELQLIEGQVNKELILNENEVVNGLYEIIMAAAPAEEDVPDAAAEIPVPALRNQARGAKEFEKSSEVIPEETSAIAPFQFDEVIDSAEPESDEDQQLDEIHALYKQIERPEAELFPKSVVKTTRGVVIGEYYYDSTAYKNSRHYIFNSLYFMEQLALGVQMLREKFDPVSYAEKIQMIADAHKRVTTNPSLHFEVSTNEILNEKTLKELYGTLKSKQYDDVISFCNRLGAKIRVLGSNYRILLKEQVERYSKESIPGA